MRQMRRKERQIPESEALDILRHCEYAVLATVDAEDGLPYCVPVSPVMLNGKLYFHCAPGGEKLDNIVKTPQVCLTAVEKTRLVPERFTTLYECAVARGYAELVTEQAEKVAALWALCEKYAAENLGGAGDAIAKSLHRTAIVRVTLACVTGKAKRPKEK